MLAFVMQAETVAEPHSCGATRGTRTRVQPEEESSGSAVWVDKKTAAAASPETTTTAAAAAAPAEPTVASVGSAEEPEVGAASELLERWRLWGGTTLASTSDDSPTVALTAPDVAAAAPTSRVGGKDAKDKVADADTAGVVEAGSPPEPAVDGELDILDVLPSTPPAGAMSLAKCKKSLDAQLELELGASAPTANPQCMSPRVAPSPSLFRTPPAHAHAAPGQSGPLSRKRNNSALRQDSSRDLSCVVPSSSHGLTLGNGNGGITGTGTGTGFSHARHSSAGTCASAGVAKPSRKRARLKRRDGNASSETLNKEERNANHELRNEISVKLRRINSAPVPCHPDPEGVSPGKVPLDFSTFEALKTALSLTEAATLAPSPLP